MLPQSLQLLLRPLKPSVRICPSPVTTSVTGRAAAAALAAAALPCATAAFLSASAFLSCCLSRSFSCSSSACRTAAVCSEADHAASVFSISVTSMSRSSVTARRASRACSASLRASSKDSARCCVVCANSSSFCCRSSNPLASHRPSCAGAAVAGTAERHDFPRPANDDEVEPVRAGEDGLAGNRLFNRSHIAHVSSRLAVGLFDALPLDDKRRLAGRSGRSDCDEFRNFRRGVVSVGGRAVGCGDKGDEGDRWPGEFGRPLPRPQFGDDTGEERS